MQSQNRVKTFQSTPSAWRETHLSRSAAVSARSFQSTPSAWRETEITLIVSVHREFQSTPSAWRETPGKPVYTLIIAISIHSLRMEGDATGRQGRASPYNFNPLPPHGGRRLYSIVERISNAFQSTPSAWRETTYSVQTLARSGISIHSLRMEGDTRSAVQVTADGYFNPLPPHGGRPTTRILPIPTNRFQSTPSAWRETAPCR